MKSDEVIKKLTDNAKQTFVNEYGIRVTNLGGFIVQANGEEFTFNVGYEWEEVLESVTFMEAINSGKRIKPIDRELFHEVDEMLKELSTKHKEMLKELSTKHKEVLKAVMNGKWDVEE